MFYWVSFILLFVSLAMAEDVGKIAKIAGKGDAFVLRQEQKILLTTDALIEKGDTLFTNDSVLLILLYPTTQMSVSKNTQIKITESLIEEDAEKTKSISLVDLVKGMIRLQVTKVEDLEIEQKIRANNVVFGVRGTEFEVSEEGENVDLDVIEGEVEVSSPHVQTFVPERVKANEGFRYNNRLRNFQRRKFLARFNHHPGFTYGNVMKSRWSTRLQKIKRRKCLRSRARSRGRLRGRSGAMPKC